ncbi:hypothetical protein [Corallococcus sp. AB045]|uniref:hypothetical protein n=1 Tax=Corallococcus sp. AB045 TaxID=2316719 RepID=UPI0011C3FDAE|nr:hypothetical protein [Corallococcus sp. AB045]
MVSDESLRKKLRSDDEFVVLKGLAELGGIVDFTPADDVLDLAMGYFRYFDSEWRRQSVFSVSLHWSYAPSLPLLIELIGKEDDEDVLDLSIMAIAHMGRNHEGLRCDVLRVLKGLVDDRTRPSRVWGLAYTCARRMCGELKPVEHARGIGDPESVRVEASWFDSALLQYGCGGKP